MAGKPSTRSQKAQPRTAGQPSDEVLLAEIGVRHTQARTMRLFLGLVGLAVVVLACWPVAHELAGRETVLNVTMALGLTASLTLAGTGVAAWGNSHRRRANRAEKRNKELSRDVKELQQRLKENDLPASVTR